jgi:quercetin dioxygenase-like cupin family protein
VSFDPNGKHHTANDEIHEVASLYSLGLLEPELAAGFERHLEGCSVCESEVRGFTEATAEVFAALEATEPPGRVREELLTRIGRSASAAVIFRAGEGEWQESGSPGLTYKQLFADPSTGNVTALIRMTAGAVVPPHRHFGAEHCYVLEGDLVFADHTLYAGDYEVAAEATDHSPVTTRHGCLLLIMNNQRDQLLA